MKTFVEILGRFIIAITNIILLLLSEPYIKDIIPEIAPYTVHIMYTCIVILGIWIIIPLIDLSYVYNHKHEMYIKE